MDYANLEFVEAVEELARRAGREVPREGGGEHRPREDLEPIYTALERANTYFRRQLRRHPQASRAVDYLKGRGLSGAIAAEFQLGFAPPAWDGILGELGTDERARAALVRGGLLIEGDGGRTWDRFRDRITFPIHDSRGRVAGFGCAHHRRRRAEVPELPRNAGVPQGPRALRAGARPRRGTLAGAAARGGGLHGRGRAGAVGDRLRGRDTRHGRDRGSRAAAVPPRQRHRVLLRRRRGRPAGGLARGVQRTPVDEGRTSGAVLFLPKARTRTVSSAPRDGTPSSAASRARCR